MPPPNPPSVVFPEALAQDVADDCKLVLMISRSDRISLTLSAGVATPDQSPCKCSIDFYSTRALALTLPSFLPLAKASINVCGSRSIIIRKDLELQADFHFIVVAIILILLTS